MKKLLKNLSARTGLMKKALFGRYPYMYSPLQLKYMMESVESISHIKGSYVEVGCAYGATTVLLKKLMDELSVEEAYYALDTFSGFVSEHAEHDIKKLNMDKSLSRDFISNDELWMHAALHASNVKGVTVIKGDASEFDYASVSPIAFCLVDVDLYQPIVKILPEVYAAMSPGGLIVVDDCKESKKWEGALIAYNEFMADRGMTPEIVCGKLGIIRKPAL